MAFFQPNVTFGIFSSSIRARHQHLELVRNHLLRPREHICTLPALPGRQLHTVLFAGSFVFLFLPNAVHDPHRQHHLHTRLSCATVHLHDHPLKGPAYMTTCVHDPPFRGPVHDPETSCMQPMHSSLSKPKTARDERQRRRIFNDFIERHPLEPMAENECFRMKERRTFFHLIYLH